MSEIEQFQAGRQAFWDGEKLDKRRNEHWQRGWKQEKADDLAYVQRRYNILKSQEVNGY